MQATDRLLWVLVTVPRAGTERLSAEARQRLDPMNRHDTMIEVIDVDRSIVVASRRVTAMLRKFACSSVSYSPRVDDDGFTFVDLVKVELRL